MKRSKKALISIISGFTMQVVAVIYGLIVPRLIIAKFGSGVNGLIASISQFLGYIVIMEAGFGPVIKAALYKPLANKNNEEIASIIKTSKRIFKRISYIFLGYLAVLCVVYPTIINTEFEFIYTFSLIIIVAVETFAEYFFGMTYRLYLQADQKSYIITLLQIVSYVLNIIFVYILIKLSVPIHIIKIVTVLVFMIKLFLQYLYVKKKYNIDLKDANDNYPIKNKWDGVAQHVAAFIHGGTDITLITIFGNLLEVSVYSVYYMVTSGMKKLISSLTSGIDALFGNMIANNEQENLNKKFSIYETIYLSFITILLSTTLVLIVPFVSIYTREITDINYIRYGFGYLMVLSLYFTLIREPYLTITYAAGYFKETKIGAWIEAGINIVLSIILLKKFGIAGVAIGTCVSVFMRMIEFIYHTNKYVIKRNLVQSIKKVFLSFIEMTIVFLIYNKLPLFENLTYGYWIINGFLIIIISTIIIVTINSIFYGKDFKEAFLIVREMAKGKKQKGETDYDK